MTSGATREILEQDLVLSFATSRKALRDAVVPCRYAQEEGLARRIPRLRRSWLYRAAWKSGKAVQSLVQRVSPVAGI